MEEKRAYDLIRAACYRRPDLQYSNWSKENAEEMMADAILESGPRNFNDYCYPVTEVFCALTGASPMCGSPAMHFWSQKGGVVWDPTEMPETPYPYENGRPAQLGEFSPRAHELLAEVLDASGEHSHRLRDL